MMFQAGSMFQLVTSTNRSNRGSISVGRRGSSPYPFSIHKDPLRRILFSILTLAGVILPAGLLAQSTPPRTRKPGATATRESTQPTPPRLIGNFKSREDHGPYSKVVYRNDLVLIVKEHHATPLASLTLLLKIPDLAPTAENELLLRIAAMTVLPANEPLETNNPGASFNSLGGITQAEVTPDRIEWTVTFPAEALQKIYPLVVQRLLKAEPSPGLVASALKTLSRPDGLNSRGIGGRELFVLTGYPASSAVPSEATPDLLNSLKQFLIRSLQAPQMIVSVVGDFERERVIQQVGENFLKLPEQPSKTKTTPASSTSKPAFHYTLLQSTDGLAGVNYYFHSKPDWTPTFAVLSSLLAQGEMSSLGHDLIYQRALASNLNADGLRVNGENFFAVHFSCPSGALDQTTVYLLARLRQFTNSLPSEDEMLRARRQFALAWELANRAPSAVSKRLAEYESGRGYLAYTSVLTDLEKVTAEEVSKAASGLFTLDTAHAIERWPLALASRTFTPESYRDFVELAVPRALNKIGKKAEQASANLPASAERPAPYVGNLDRSQLKAEPWNRYSILRGPNVFVNEFHLSPLVIIELLYPGGQFFESNDNAGMTALAVRSSIQSAKDKTHDELWFQLESLGATLIPIVENDLFGYALITPPSTAPACIDLLLEMLLEPRFSPEDVAAVKPQLLETLQSQLDSPRRFAADKLRSTFFSHTDLYPSLAKRMANVRKATEKDVSAWWDRIQKDIQPTLVILGDTQGTEYVAPFARKLSSSKWKPGAFEPLQSIKAPKLPAMVQDSSPTALSSLLMMGFNGPGFGVQDTDVIEIAKWLFKDVFSHSGVTEFFYLRSFEGDRDESAGDPTVLANQALGQMSALLASNTAVPAAQKMWQTHRRLQDLDSLFKGLTFFRRSFGSSDVESAGKAEQTVSQMTTSQLRQALAAIFQPQNMLACFVTPASPH
ncbi:MAG: insulinase family protein [Acidobacteriia bacterium]|nr:insulinase family protein [Terriglobia bacterium]